MWGNRARAFTGWFGLVAFEWALDFGWEGDVVFPWLAGAPAMSQRREKKTATTWAGFFVFTGLLSDLFPYSSFFCGDFSLDSLKY